MSPPSTEPTKGNAGLPHEFQKLVPLSKIGTMQRLSFLSRLSSVTYLAGAKPRWVLGNDPRLGRMPIAAVFLHMTFLLKQINAAPGLMYIFDPTCFLFYSTK